MWSRKHICYNRDSPAVTLVGRPCRLETSIGSCAVEQKGQAVRVEVAQTELRHVADMHRIMTISVRLSPDAGARMDVSGLRELLCDLRSAAAQCGSKRP